MLISIYALNIQEEIPTEALLLSDHRLSVLTTNNTEHSKVMIIKFLLNICIKYKIILCSTSFFSDIFNTVGFANLGDKQAEKQQTIISPLSQPVQISH